MLARAILITALGATCLSGAMASDPPGIDVLSRIQNMQNDLTCRNAAENAFNGTYNPAQLALDARSCSSRYGRGGAGTLVGLPKTTSQLKGSLIGPISKAINGCKVETVLRQLSAIEDTVEQELLHRWWHLHGLVEKTSKLANDLETGIESTSDASLSAEDRAAATDYLKRTGLIEIDGASERAIRLVHEKVLEDFKFYQEDIIEKEVVYSSQVRLVANDWMVATNRPNCPPVTTSGVAQKKPNPPTGSGSPGGSEQPPKPVPETVGEEEDIAEITPSRPDVTVEFDLGGRYSRLPDLSLGILSFNTNLNSLHDLDVDLYGPVVSGVIKIGPAGPFDQNEGWHGKVGGEFARQFGEDKDSISSFPLGQMPTYIDIAGLSGFAFNDNSRINAEFDMTSVQISGELGYKKKLSDSLFLSPYGGLLYRFAETNTNVILETDYLNGTFVNSLNEEVRENQIGFDAGLDMTHLFNSSLSLTLGGHVGGLFTNAKYRGRDCGDGSIATAGCDKNLFSNTGITADNSSFDVFGGLKAALGFYVFCREHKTEILAGVITAAVDQLKKHCVEVVASASVNAMPISEITRPTQTGVGQELQLGTAYSINSTARFGVNIGF